MKLADVGVAKHEKDITGTTCGTFLYLAPEVFEGRIYNSKADMYSFGFVLWELWYGKIAFEDTVVRRPQTILLEDVRQGLRPPHIDGTNQPWKVWQEVMESCWQMDASLRLNAQVAWECFNQLQKDLSTPPPPPPPPPPPKKPQALRQLPRIINEIDDIAEMFQAMAVLDIPCKGLKTLDQMKDRIRDKLNQSAKAPRWTAGQV